MDADDNLLALLGGGPQEEQEDSDTGKKEKKKKQLSPKQLKKLQQKQEEQARVEAAQARHKLLEDTKERIQKEWVYNKNKLEVFESEHEKRIKQLNFAFEFVDEINDKWLDYLKYLQKQRDWEEYMKCNKLPNPSSFSEMNTYLFKWTKIEKDVSVQYCIQKTKEVVELLKGLDDYIFNPGPDISSYKVSNWKEMRNKVRNLLQDQIDKTTYNLFSRIDANLTAVDVTTNRFLLECLYFKMCLWAELIVPIPSSRGLELILPLSISFDEVGILVVLPVSLVEVHKVMRVLWMNYDHWTDRCRSFDDPPIPEHYKKDLIRLTIDEYEMKKEVMDRSETKKQILKKKIQKFAPEASSQELLAWDSEPQRVLSEEVAIQEGELETAWKNDMKMKLNDYEVNLRERTFLGGIIFVDVMHQPPQPKYLRFKHDVTLISEAPELRYVEYHEKYIPPDPAAVAASKEQLIDKKKSSLFAFGESKARGRKVQEPPKVVEDENEIKLVLVSLKLPETVLWFETPQPAIWDPSHNYWSTEDVYKTKYNAEEKILSFRAGRLGPIGLHVNRYYNIPFEDWILEADRDGNIDFSLKTNKITLKFKIQENQVCLESIQNAPSKAMNWILGTYYTPLKLVQLLIKGGIDVFPPLDASCYVAKVEPKNFIAENHVYQIFGLFSLSFEFRFSKFNQVAGRRHSVFQAREIHKGRESKFCLIKTSPADATILDINEDSWQFSDHPAPGLEAPKKKKLSKKEKQRLADEYDKLMKAQMEQERLRQVKEEKERAERERKLAKERAKREVAEQEMRCGQLVVTCKLFKKLKSKMKDLERNNRSLEEWNQYMKCDGLPDPNSFSQMNTYLFLWTGDETTNEIEKALQKTDEVLQIRNDMRYQQQKHLDTATYKLLRNLEKNLQPIDLTTCKFMSTSQHFTLYLWAEIVLPVPVSGANENKNSLTVDFPDVGVSLLLPPSLSNFHMAIRALWLKYDHCSDLCPSHDGPENTDVNTKDLNEFTLEEWEIKCELQQQRENEMKKQKTKGKDKNANIELPKPMEPQKSIADIIADKEEEQIKKWKKEMMTETAPHEVNLRKCCVLGGVLHLDLLERPPQPRDLRGKYVITVLDTPPGLNPVPYYEHYVPPPPPEPGARRTPEEIEVEVKKHEEALEKLSSVTISAAAEKNKSSAEELKREVEKERELQKLAVVTVELPETVLWFEPPMAANWDPVNNYWSTEEIHDLKFNEDKQTLTFRSGRMGLMALVAYRYCNLPYQTWELKPDFKGPPGGVVFGITASVVIIEFIIREDKICLSQLQNGATGALQEIVGTFYKPKKLMKLMQTGGVDVFPPPDAFCYVEGAVPKHRVAEDHLYHCMAMVSTSYNFAWSRWNLLAGRRNMVLQMREAIDRKRLPNYNILHVTPLKATIVDCTEVSTSFNEEGIEGMKFYADLYNLVLDQCSKPAKKKIEEIPFTLTETVHQLLCATRPFCFS